MRKYGLTGILCAVLALGAAGCGDDGAANVEFFEAILVGSEEVPPRSTAATGNATFSFDGSVLTFRLEVENINDVLFAHIHAAAPRGVNAGARVFLHRGIDAGGPTISVGPRTVLAAGTATTSDASPAFPFNEVLNAMRTGNAYVNVHTRQFPGGEIRGQISLIN